MTSLRVTLALLLAAGGSRAADVRLDDGIKDEALRRDVLAVCRDVVAVVGRRIAVPPALGEKPFVIRKPADNTPRADLGGLPREYWLNIPCADTRDYCLLTYQLGHELAHAYIDPRRANWFIESAATAVSLICLTEMGERWKTNAPLAAWQSWAHHFPEYRQQIVTNRLAELRLQSVEEVPEWVRAQLPALIAAGRVDRAAQHACALRIEAVLRKQPASWGALCRLGLATTEDGHTDFAAWERLVQPSERALVRELAVEFGN